MNQRKVGFDGPICFAVVEAYKDPKRWGIGVVEKDVQGYRLYDGLRFETEALAKDTADHMNGELGHSATDVAILIASSMRIVERRRRG